MCSVSVFVGSFVFNPCRPRNRHQILPLLPLPKCSLVFLVFTTLGFAVSKGPSRDSVRQVLFKPVAGRIGLSDLNSLPSRHRVPQFFRAVISLITLCFYCFSVFHCVGNYVVGCMFPGWLTVVWVYRDFITHSCVRWKAVNCDVFFHQHLGSFPLLMTPSHIHLKRSGGAGLTGMLKARHA